MIPGLALVGSGMDSCIIDTKDLAVPQDFVAVRVKENGILKGFHIIVSNNRWGTGIYLRHITGLKHKSFTNRNKISNANTGIWLKDMDNGICKENIVVNAGSGIKITNFYDSQTIVEDNFISDVSGDGIVVSLAGKPVIRNNTIVDDDLINGIFGGGPDTLFLDNNLLVLNDIFSQAIQLPIFPSFSRNNIILGDINSEGIFVFNQGNIISNNVITGFNVGIRPESSTNLAVTHNSFWDNNINIFNQIPDSTNVFVDPMFVDPKILDFHLQMFSPLIDAGDPNILDKEAAEVIWFTVDLTEKLYYQDDQNRRRI